MNVKTIIAIVITSFVLCNCFYVFSFANNIENGVENFYSQVKALANQYDESGGLTSNGSEIIDTCRLIVKTKTDNPLENYYGAVAVVEGYDGLHFLQYLNEVQADYAYKKLSFDDIEYVEYDFYMEHIGTEAVADESNSKDNHLSWNSDAVQVDNAFELIEEAGIECNDVRIAVIDTGVYADHNYFNNDVRERIIDSGFTYDVLKTDDNNVDYTEHYSSMEDDLYHGTFVAGVIFDNSMDNIKIIPYRITNSKKTLYSDILAAFEHILWKNAMDAENPIEIVNMSFANSLDQTKECIRFCQKVKEATSNGMVIVAGAGNDTISTDNIIPADIPEVITVSATDESNNIAFFSNFGNSVDITAPGTNITSPTPRTFYDEDKNKDEVCDAYSAYITTDGTSFSTPLVAAAAATLKSIKPELTAYEIQRIIKETAYVPENWKESCGGENYGTGIVNFYNMVKAVLEPEYSTVPIIKVNSDNKFEIVAPHGTDARFYYTIDGSVPTIDNHIKYTEPFNLINSYNEKLIAVCHENGKLIGEPVSYDLITEKTKTIFYKWSANPLHNEDSKMLNCKINDPSVAAVDDEGNITGLSPGDTKITYYMASGKRVICDVNVIYAPWQWIIRILFLGFLWY